MTVSFDTLAYARRLKAGGFTEQQAEVQAEALASVVSDPLATKQDVREVEHQLKELEYRLTIRIGGMLTVAIGVVAALTKLL